MSLSEKNPGKYKMKSEKLHSDIVKNQDDVTSSRPEENLKLKK